MSAVDMMTTHQRLLVAAAVRTTGPILELGCGWYSTPLLHEIARAQGRQFVALDTDEGWVYALRNRTGADVRTVKGFTSIVPPLTDWPLARMWGLAFVDSAPKESRVPLVRGLIRQVDVFVLHDTEGPATEDAAAYGWDRILGDLRHGGDSTGLFPFQRTDKTHRVWTTVAAVTIDVERWFK